MDIAYDGSGVEFLISGPSFADMNSICASHKVDFLAA